MARDFLTRLCFTLLLTLQLLLAAEAFDPFGRKKRERQRAEAEALRLSKLVVIFGLEINKTLFYIVTLLVAAGIGGFLLNSQKLVLKKQRGNRPDTDGTLDVVVVGCGLPKKVGQRFYHFCSSWIVHLPCELNSKNCSLLLLKTVKGMGWYHLTQLLEMSRVNVTAVVEPFFMNEKLCPEPPAVFLELTHSLEAMGIETKKSVDDLSVFTKPTMCLIAGRTAENPELFRQCVERGAQVIYLEKPGAPTVKELEDMRTLAEEKNVKVYLGYNKNVTPYVLNTIKVARETPNSHVFFCHNNSYSTSDLPEVFARNSEGMLKNMAIHELALLVMFFQVTVDNIEKFKVNTDKLFSEQVTIWKPGTSLPNPVYIVDFSRVAFKITTKAGTNVSLMADRCGGNVSFAVVKDVLGKEVKRFDYPDPETAALIDEKVAKDPQMMPYFLVQSDDYKELKDRVVNATLDSRSEGPEGVATITVGIEALKLAEYATDQLNKALKSK